MATQSSFRFLAAIMVAFSLFFVAACGDVEEDAPTPTPTADAGYDIGTDTSPDDASTPDTAPDPDEVTYSELCSECESRGEQCPDQSRLLSWQREKALSVDEAADELCIDTVDPCTDFYDIADYVWSCENFDVGTAGGTFEARPSGGRCEVWRSWRGGGSASGPLDPDGFIDYELTESDSFGWIYISSRSIARLDHPSLPLSHCTGTAKE